MAAGAVLTAVCLSVLYICLFVNGISEQLDFHEIWGLGISWTREESIKFWKVRARVRAHLLLAGNDTWRGGGMHSADGRHVESVFFGS